MHSSGTMGHPLCTENAFVRVLPSACVHTVRTSVMMALEFHSVPGEIEYRTRATTSRSQFAAALVQ